MMAKGDATMQHRRTFVRAALAGLLAAALWLSAPVAPGQDQNSGLDAADSLGYRTKNPEAEKLRIEREMPVVRAQARTAGLRQAGRLVEALMEAGRASELARQVGDDLLFYSTRQMEGRVLVDLGRYAEALPCLLTGIHTGGSDGVKTDISLCRLKLGDLKGARTYDVQGILASRYAHNALGSLPGASTSVRMEASLWLDRAQSTEGHFLRSQWAIRAARICPTCVAANWVAAFELGCLGQRATERKYLLRAASGARCYLQGDATNRLASRPAEECKDRYRQGTVPPPGEGIDPVPDPQG